MTLKIGDHADASESLQQTHERAQLFQAIIESMGESVLVVDRQGREVYSNQELARFRGRVPSGGDMDSWRTPQRMRIFDAERRELPFDQWPVARALRGDYATNFEIIVTGMAHREGDTVLSISTRSMVNSAGDVVGAVIVTRDITDLRRTENELRQSQKLEAIGQLTGGIAHDFNNLLTVILGNADALVARLHDRPHVQRLAKTLALAAERGAELTHHMLAFSRRQPMQPTSVDVGTLVEQMRDLLSRALGEGVELSVTGATDLWPARVDAALLETSILNLCINARDAMEHGGRLVIDLSNVDSNAGGAEAATLPPGQFLRITVSDSGAGIAPEVIDRVFEPFFTTKAVGKGTGLGLSMVYGFVKQSGGDVRIQSEAGIGTSVVMYLPRSPDAAHVAPVSAQLPEELGGSEAILLVEDNELVREHAHQALVSLGYRVTCARTGPEAVTVLARSGGQFDLLFSDIQMPGGMTGAKLAEVARIANPKLRILLTTGYVPESASETTYEMFPLLRKPYSILDLARAVRLALTQTSSSKVA